MANYDPSAKVHGVCIDLVTGCQHPDGENYRSDATTGGVADCHFVGCMDSSKADYNPTANHDGGVCAEDFMGCMDSRASNYFSHHTIPDASCSIGGCTDPASAEYDSEATFSIPGACVSSARRRLAGSTGCADPAASTYDSSASAHDASACRHAGCNAAPLLHALDARPAHVRSSLWSSLDPIRPALHGPC